MMEAKGVVRLSFGIQILFVSLICRLNSSRVFLALPPPQQLLLCDFLEMSEAEYRHAYMLARKARVRDLPSEETFLGRLHALRQESTDAVIDLRRKLGQDIAS